MTNYCKRETRECWLGREFGEQFAIRQFGAEVVAGLPRVTRGKNAGKHKASIEWVKVIQGGWDSEAGRPETRIGQVIACRLIIRSFNGDLEILQTKGESRFRD